MELKTRLASGLNKTGLKALIEEYRYGRYCEDSTFAIASSRKLLLNTVSQYVSQDGGLQLEALSSGDQVEGTLLFKPSSWDTEHFGYPVAVVDSVYLRNRPYGEQSKIMDALLERFQSWLNENKIRFVSAQAPTLDLAVLHGFERWGFGFIETDIFNKCDLRKTIFPEKSPETLRLARPEDRSTMVRHSRGAFSSQRFYADPHIDTAKADSLYEKWITTVFSDPNQKVLVLDVAGAAAAFMVYHIKDLNNYFGLRFAMWKMAILDPALRGKGVGTRFFNALKHYHRDEGLDVVDSCFTMRNVTSFNLHNRCDFKLVSSIVTFHKWL